MWRLMSTWGFCSWLFKHGLSFQSAFVLKARMGVLFILPRYNEQTGEGGRLADMALIRASKGFDKQRGEGYLSLAVLNRGVEGHGGRQQHLLPPKHRLRLNPSCHERGKSWNPLLESKNVKLFFIIWSVLLFLSSPSACFCTWFQLWKFLSPLWESLTHHSHLWGFTVKPWYEWELCENKLPDSVAPHILIGYVWFWISRQMKYWSIEIERFFFKYFVWYWYLNMLCYLKWCSEVLNCL